MGDDEGSGREGRPGGGERSLGLLVGKFMDRSRIELERAARRGRDLLTLRQLRTDRDRMYQKIGKETRALLEAGELDHPGVRRGVDKVKELEIKIQEAEDQMRGFGQEPEPDPGVTAEAVDEPAR